MTDRLFKGINGSVFSLNKLVVKFLKLILPNRPLIGDSLLRTDRANPPPPDLPPDLAALDNVAVAPSREPVEPPSFELFLSGALRPFVWNLVKVSI